MFFSIGVEGRVQIDQSRSPSRSAARSARGISEKANSPKGAVVRASALWALWARAPVAVHVGGGRPQVHSAPARSAEHSLEETIRCSRPWRCDRKRCFEPAALLRGQHADDRTRRAGQDPTPSVRRCSPAPSRAGAEPRCSHARASAQQTARGRVGLWRAASDPAAATSAPPQGPPRQTLERAPPFGRFSFSEIPRAKRTAEHITPHWRHSPPASTNQSFGGDPTRRSGRQSVPRRPASTNPLERRSSPRRCKRDGPRHCPIAARPGHGYDSVRGDVMRVLR
jgi:hypothetical protein